MSPDERALLTPHLSSEQRSRMEAAQAAWDQARAERARREQEEQDRWDEEVRALVKSFTAPVPPRAPPLLPPPVVVEDAPTPLTDAELDEMIGAACRDVAIKRHSWEQWEQARTYLPGLPKHPPWAAGLVLDEADIDELIG